MSTLTQRRISETPTRSICCVCDKRWACQDYGMPKECEMESNQKYELMNRLEADEAEWELLPFNLFKWVEAVAVVLAVGGLVAIAVAEILRRLG